ncbi:MAG TPA: caspase family protein [Acidimicrobiales bacterium]|nr:caspase family protein [Acidimicrobiales bacterium]
MQPGGRVLAVVVLVGALLASASGASAAPRVSDDRWALVIGAGKQAGKSKGAVGARGDAEAVNQALLNAGFARGHIRLLIDSAATASAIRQGLDWLRANSNDRTFSTFHYSGHVLQRGGDRDKDGEAVDEYLMPYDSRNLISDRELSERLRGVRGWLWADIAGCEAAGFDEGGLSSPRRLVTASSQESEKSFERPDWQMSVFTGLLVDQGMNKRQADPNGDATVSIQAAFRYAAKLAPEMTARQKLGPQHPYMAGGDGPEWHLRPPPPPAPRQAESPSGKLCVVLCLR